ncbi:helix-turn-helix domain-containing protein [Actinomadura sp. KC216]|uniref:helix-turn-helix domain-containing protein n=1 Tax=unclassified Actinomadura TaxID=2626254 RepID=UPI001043E880|nr:helix-turn-helix domain-containing protein [Actinomadura sp. KC216]TDB78218.1 helix-turn-helix domain-containing protein [Actinomadura sp. KC216]
MVRTPLTDEQRDRGKALGQILRAARGPRPAAAVAAEAGISLDTLRKIERGAIAVPAFYTVASLARVLDLDLTDLAKKLDEFDRTIPESAAS